MIKTAAVVLLGLFFVLNGVNHAWNERTLEAYARRRGLISPVLLVRLSGVLLFAGGLSLMTGVLSLYGIVGLCVFLVVASFTIHRFWCETDPSLRMLELMHFTKNFAILFELIYLATTL